MSADTGRSYKNHPVKLSKQREQTAVRRVFPSKERAEAELPSGRQVGQVVGQVVEVRRVVLLDTEGVDEVV